LAVSNCGTLVLVATAQVHRSAKFLFSLAPQWGASISHIFSAGHKGCLKASPRANFALKGLPIIARGKGAQRPPPVWVVMKLAPLPVALSRSTKTHSWRGERDEALIRLHGSGAAQRTRPRPQPPLCPAARLMGQDEPLCRESVRNDGGRGGRVRRSNCLAYLLTQRPQWVNLNLIHYRFP
jgi:hypothetical protein